MSIAKKISNGKLYKVNHFNSGIDSSFDDTEMTQEFLDIDPSTYNAISYGGNVFIGPSLTD